MSEISSTFRIPNLEKTEAFNFVAPEAAVVYAELNAIAEEIEQCRLAAC